MVKNSFGGVWTIEKLNILSEYLNFYIQALKNQTFYKIYIDAFAGTGQIELEEFSEQIPGSARIALEIEEKFDKYIFIEQKKSFCKELTNLIDNDYQAIKTRVDIVNGDANQKLKDIICKYDWKSCRAVLFLDPYATSVTWETLKIIAKTQAIDVWYLFPIGATTRLLKKDKNIDITWQRKLNSIFGDDSWIKELYKESLQLNLFGDIDYTKQEFSCLINYIKKRLKTIFPFVADNPRVLYNTKNSPLFLFCFAVSNPNPKAWGLAQKGANYILSKK